jgi:type II secretory pathway component PulC
MNSKKIFVLGNLIAVALVFWITASIAFTWASQRRGTGFVDRDLPGPPSSRSAVPPHDKNLELYSTISEKDIFHTGKVDSKSPVREEAVIQVTERNLELKGTVVGEGPKSYAVIVNHDSSKEDIYFEDDFVMGARVARILKNRVILDSNGKEEALLMSDERRALPELGSSYQPGPASRATPPERGVITLR